MVNLIGEGTGASGENYRPVASHWQTLSHNVVSSTCTDCTGSCKSNYHTVYSDHDGPHIYKRARILCWNTAGGEEQLLNDVLYIKVNTKYGSEWQHNFYAFFYSKNIKKFTPKIWYSMRMMTPKIWYPMKLMTHKFDIPWSWWPTNLISYEVDDYKFDILWSNDYKFDTRWSWWPTNLISYEVDDPQIWYPMKLVTHKFDIPWSLWHFYFRK